MSGLYSGTVSNRTAKGTSYAKITQKKTKGTLYLPISPEAIKQLPPKGNDIDFVFGKLPDNSYIDKLLKIWAKDAGITKEPDFSCKSPYVCHVEYNLRSRPLYS